MYYQGVPFSWNAEIGRVFAIQSASLSIASCFLFLGYITYHGLRYKLRPPIMGLPQWHFMPPLVRHYLLILLINDLDFVLGSLLHMKWAALARIGDPSIAAHIEFMKQMGNLSVTLSASGMAFHTFSVLFFNWRPPAGQIFPFTALAIIWIFVAVISVIPHDYNYYTATPPLDPLYSSRSITWYFIGEPDAFEWFSFQRVDLWFAAAINIALYVAFFVYLRKSLAAKSASPVEGVENNASEATSPKTSISQNAEELGAIPALKRTLAYPILYIILVAPMSMVRFVRFTNRISPAILYWDEDSPKWGAFNAVFLAITGCLTLILCFLTPQFQRLTSPRTARQASPQSDAGVGNSGQNRTEKASFVSATEHQTAEKRTHVAIKSCCIGDEALSPVPVEEVDVTRG